MKNLKLIFLLFSTLVFLQASADITLPSIFGDHMVLQQQTDAALWGTATSGKNVKIVTSWDEKNYSVRADNNGKWKVAVKTPVAGGPFQITISDGTALTLKDVLIGEVWVCSGQSNMQMPMRGYYNQPILGANRAVATGKNDKIRLLTVTRSKSLSPEADFEGNWNECTPEHLVDFSAAAYFFGEMLHEALDVPVGLISSSWGGTRIEPWMSASGVANFDWVTPLAKDHQGDFSQQQPSVLYNAMIAPMVGYGIRGAIWYQGESNRNQPAEYEKLMSGLIENWRDEWGIQDLSFYYAQIAPYDYGPNGFNSAFLREAQLHASTVTTKTGMACLMDIGEKHNIHPADKRTVGERLAFQALAKTYGQKGIEYSGPVFKTMEVEGSVANLSFDHVDNGMTTFGKELTNFQVAGDDKRFYDANAFITREGISVSSPRVAKPVAVRYAFEDWVIGELFNSEGLPASSFRTDDWEMEEK